MPSKYKDLEKRKKYMQGYRDANREKINSYHRERYKKGIEGYVMKGKRGLKLNGTCGVGREYELLSLNLLPGSIDKNNENFKGKWDIEWNGLKIDVKMKNWRPGHYWTFSKKNNVADYYLLFCVKDKTINNIYLIPCGEFKNNYLHIGINGKYKKYFLRINCK